MRMRVASLGFSVALVFVGGLGVGCDGGGLGREHDAGWRQ